MITWDAVVRIWNAFFFVDEPTAALALFRILFGCLLVANAALFARDARFWIGPGGVLSHDEYCRVHGHTRFTLLRYLPPTETSVTLVLVAHVAAALLLTAGVMTHWSAAVAWLTLVSLHQRNQWVTYGADNVMRILGFLLIFSHAGDAASFDRWWATRAGAVPAPASAWCTRLMQLQVSTIYFQAFLCKFAGRTWIDGSAVYYAIEVPKHRRTHLPRFARSLGWSRLASWSTVAIEGALGPLVWLRELRMPIVIAGVALHIGMEVFMNLHLFSITMAICLVLFVDAHQAEWLLRFLGLS